MILLVEDDVAICDLVAEILQSASFDVLVATSPEEAISLWEKHHTEVDLLLTDMVLGAAHGQELIRRLRDDRADLRVLQMTGYDPERGPGDTDPVIAKPFTPEELLEAVRRAMA